MLEINISFIFHLFFILIGCKIISFFFNKLYDNIIEYKKKENKDIDLFNNNNNLLKEKIEVLQKDFIINQKQINDIINISIIEQCNESSKKLKFQMQSNIIISNEKKILINNFYIALLKNIN